MDLTATRDHVLSSLEGSRSALGRDPDIILLHQSAERTARDASFWRMLVELIGGSVPGVQVGVSVYDVRWTQEVLAAAPEIIRAVQIPYNAFDRRFDALARDFTDLGIRVISRSAFLKGLLPLPTADLPPWAGDLVAPKRRLDELAEAGGTSVADLVLRWCLRAGFIESTLLGVDSAAELRENSRALAPRPELEPILDEVDGIEVDPETIDPRRWIAFGF